MSSHRLLVGLTWRSLPLRRPPTVVGVALPDGKTPKGQTRMSAYPLGPSATKRDRSREGADQGTPLSDVGASGVSGRRHRRLTDGDTAVVGRDEAVAEALETARLDLGGD